MVGNPEVMVRLRLLGLLPHSPSPGSVVGVLCELQPLLKLSLQFKKFWLWLNFRSVTAAGRGGVTNLGSADPSESDQIRDRQRDTTSIRHDHQMRSEATRRSA